MPKFDDIIKDQYVYITEEEASMPTAPADLDPAGGAPGAVQPPVAPKGVTTEGKRFMIELLVKALAFDPTHLSEFDISIFDEEVTAENAENILGRIKSIVTADVDSTVGK